MKLHILKEGVNTPSYAHEGDAGLDLRSTISTTLNPGSRTIVPCGFSMELPKGYAGFVLPRSGLATKHGITVANAPGLIDSGYRGEVMVSLINQDPNASFNINEGDRIAQLVIMPYPEINLILVDELSSTEREDGAFGSSGTH